jgi:hypothetical protein
MADKVFIVEDSGDYNRRKEGIIDVEIKEKTLKDLTVAELKQQCDSKNIAYSSKATKQQLLALLGE